MANINRVQFASKDTRRLLPGWILWPPDVKEIDVPRSSGSPWITWPGVQAALKINSTAIGRRQQRKGKASKCRTDQVVRRFCSSGQKIQASLYWIIAIDWADHTKYQVDRVKISTRPPPHHSQTQFGSASTQVHQEECNPPSRRVHKVRKAWHTESEYPLR